MSTRDFVSEHGIRLKLSALALAVGACLGGAAGMYATFQPEVRPVAAGYVVGSIMRDAGACAYPAFGQTLRPCEVDAAVNRALESQTEPLEVRQLAYVIADGRDRILKRWIPFTAIGAATFTWLLLAWRNRRAWFDRPDTIERYLRGAQSVSDRELSRLGRCMHGKGTLSIGSVVIPYEVEPYHLLMVGGTGQGKTVGITGMADGIHRRGDRAIIADYKSTLLARFGFHPERGDIILNPLDARSIDWSPLAEMFVPYDADTVANSLVPDAEGEQGHWNQLAQTFLAAILLRLFSTDGNNRELLRVALEADRDELRKILAGTPAAGQVGEGDDRTFKSIRTTITAHLRALQYCAPDAGRTAFSIRKWAAEGAGWAFFNYTHDQIRVLAPLAATMLDMAATGVMAQKPDSNRRTWLVLDELSALGTIGGLEDFLTKARQSGGCAILGLQSIAQLRKRYGKDGTESMLSCLTSQLILNVSDPDTAEFLSRALGDVQIVRQTRGGSKADQGSHTNWSQTVQTHRLVLPSEIGSLQKLHGFLRLAGGLPIASIRLRIPNRSCELDDRFVLRDLSNLITPASAPAETSGTLGTALDLPIFSDEVPQS